MDAITEVRVTDQTPSEIHLSSDWIDMRLSTGDTVTVDLVIPDIGKDTIIADVQIKIDWTLRKKC
jgi:hypothetical protein